MTKIEKLRETNERLTKLLNDEDGEGMATWWEAVRSVVAELRGEFSLEPGEINAALRALPTDAARIEAREGICPHCPLRFNSRWNSVLLPRLG